MSSVVRTVTFSLKDSARGLAGAMPDIEQRDAINLLNLQTLVPEIQQKFMAADECTAVYHGCGSCNSDGRQGARVDFYCGSGGSAPDYSVCEAC
jgi:hypothetical protein